MLKPAAPVACVVRGGLLLTAFQPMTSFGFLSVFQPMISSGFLVALHTPLRTDESIFLV